MNDDARPGATRRRPDGSGKIRPPRALDNVERRSPVTPHAPTHDEIEKLAYLLWQERGAPVGSPEVDWERAEQALLEDARQGEAEPLQQGPAGRSARRAHGAS